MLPNKDMQWLQTVCSKTCKGIKAPLDVYLIQDANGAVVRPLDWGLRSREDLHEGQFIGLYLGLVGKWSQMDCGDGNYQLSLDHFYEALRDVHDANSDFRQARFQRSCRTPVSSMLTCVFVQVLQLRSFKNHP